ncbi:class I SAM-dependent methyltransferase [Desulfitobacterium sp. THU1]|uniref:class I SAM-dependent methyltransferase n=1 Tax=Desulfitobacterium sp. THU1 TaxID=3138072 RepID=UPI00311D599B
MKRDRCPICGSEKKAAIYSHKLEPISGIPTLYDSVTVCGDCDNIYAEAVMDQEVYDRYYSVFSKYETNYQEAESTLVYAQHLETANLLSNHCPKPESAIADLGAGHGTTLKILKSIGYDNLCAVELSADNCRHITDDLGIASVNKSIFALSERGGGFGEFCHHELDGIILEGVMEHIVDLHRLVDTMSLLLKSGGIVVACVPAFGINPLDKVSPFEEFSPEHINFFTEDSLTLLMNLHGFTALEHRFREGILYSAFVKHDSEDIAEKYINHSFSQISETLRLIEGYSIAGKPIAIRGTGLLTRYLFANSELGKCNIVAVADSNRNYQGLTIAGHTISTPEVFRKLTSDVDIFVISYFYTEAIQCELQAEGIVNNIICLPIKLLEKN